MTTDDQSDPLVEVYQALAEQARRAMAAQGETLRPELATALGAVDLALSFRHFIRHGFEPEANIVQPLDLHPEVLRAVVAEQIRLVLGERRSTLVTDEWPNPANPVDQRVVSSPDDCTAWVIRRTDTSDLVKDTSVLGPDDGRRNIHWTSQLHEAFRWGNEADADYIEHVIKEGLSGIQIEVRKVKYRLGETTDDDVVWFA